MKESHHQETLELEKIEGYKIEYSKVSKDGSGKATIIKTDNTADIVWGTISSISREEKKLLDEAEGLGKGYDELNLKIITDTGESIYLLTYIANVTSIDNSFEPYNWYKKIVIAGANQHNIDQVYISNFLDVNSKKDANEKRAEKELSILNK